MCRMIGRDKNLQVAQHVMASKKFGRYKSEESLRIGSFEISENQVQKKLIDVFRSLCKLSQWKHEEIYQLLETMITDCREYNAKDVENTSTDFSFDHQTGWSSGSTTITTDKISWMWKRAPSYFDVVTYSGTGSNKTVSHNLGVAPEMMIVKRRTLAGGQWKTYISSLGNNKSLALENVAEELERLKIW